MKSTSAITDEIVTDKKPRGESHLKRLIPVLTIGLLAAIPLIPLLTTSNINYPLQVIILMFFYITVSSSWNIFGGYMGYTSLGHNAFSVVGGYFSAMLLREYGIPIFASAILAGFIAMGLALIVGVITLRLRRGPTFIIATVALVLILRIVMDNWDLIGGANGITIPFLDIPVQYSKLPMYYAFLILSAVTVFVSYKIRHSKFGLTLIAISQDEVRAESAGIPTSYYKILAFMISSYFVGVAGALWAQHLTYITPVIYLAIIIGARPVLMSLLGGKGTVVGPIIGSVAIILLDEIVRTQLGSSEFNIAITGIVLLLVLLFFPEGIIGSLRKSKRLPSWLDWDKS